LYKKEKKSVSILHCSIHGTSKVFSLNPCYVLLRCCSTCVITFSDDKLTICNLSWLRIMWSLCYMNIYSYSSVLCCYYVYYGSSLCQVPLFLTKANTLLERLVVRMSFNKHDYPCWPLLFNVSKSLPISRDLHVYHFSLFVFESLALYLHLYNIYIYVLTWLTLMMSDADGPCFASKSSLISLAYYFNCDLVMQAPNHFFSWWW